MELADLGRSGLSGPARHAPPTPRPTVPDVVAGASVGLVLVPQSLAYAVLAGMPPATGLLVAVVATLAAAPFVSAPTLQTGPTAVTSLLTFGALTGLASPGTGRYVELASLLALLVGGIRIAVWLGRVGQIAYLVSEPVLAGFRTAAAVVIAASQLPTLLGARAGDGATLVAAWRSLASVGEWHAASIALGLGTVALMLGARALHPLVPGALVAVVVGLAVGAGTPFDGEMVGEIPVTLPSLTLGLPWGATLDLLLPGVIIALVGFSEVTAIARTRSLHDDAPWDPDREFLSQGAANVAAGIVGGFPAGGSFSRTALNRLAGARTRWSGLFAGLVVLALLPVAGALEALPAAVLAGIIFAAVVPLMDARPIAELRRYSRQQFVIALTTAAAALVLAPQVHWAVIIGVLLAVAAHLRRERRLPVEHWQRERVLHLRPVGVLYFANAHVFDQEVARLLADHPGTRRLVVHFDAIGRADVTGAYALRSALRRVAAGGVEVEVTGLQPGNRKIIERVLDASDPEEPIGGGGAS